MIKGVIFDLDGVIVTTDNYHYLAWESMAKKENIYFDRQINERLRGVSRFESLNIILEKSKKTYSDKEKKELAEYKNNIYKELIKKLSPEDILPGVLKLLKFLKNNNIKVAIGSSSKNTLEILKSLNILNLFDAVADGNQIKNSKPDPEVFLLASNKLALEPKECLVIEDAEAGIIAGKRGNFKTLAVGSIENKKIADYYFKDLSDNKIYDIFKL
jgi:beta-phosphoglucomutase